MKFSQVPQVNRGSPVITRMFDLINDKYIYQIKQNIWKIFPCKHLNYQKIC